MAPKDKKEKQHLSGDKNCTSRRPWLDLPQPLLRLISRQSTLMQRISYGCVTKSWRAAPRQCSSKGKSQLPQLSDGDDGGGFYNDEIHPNFFNILFYQGCIWWYSWKPRSPLLYSDYPWTHFVGYSHGVLVARGPTQPGIYLWHPVERYWCQFPSWDSNIPIKFVTLSSSLEDQNCVVLVLTATCSPAFVFCRMRRGEYKWIRQDCTVIDQFASNQQFMQFTNAIGFKGKFYALSLQGRLAVVEDINSCLGITAVSTSRAVPSALSRHFREYLVESDGEILLVFLISKRYISVVDEVEVFRLEFPRLEFIKMASLGDKTLFVGAHCVISVNGSKVGCRSNCVYFTHSSVDGWWVYDMESGSISPGWSTADSRTKFLVWNEQTGEEELAVYE